MEPDVVTLEVRALRPLDLEGVRAVWHQKYGPPPKLRSVDLLKRLLAWRMQADAYGGLTAQTRRKLKSAGSNVERSLAPGLRVAREWKGVRHDVIVLVDGFLYDGKIYASLSIIARQITGARWSGPRFFGLRDEEQT